MIEKIVGATIVPSLQAFTWADQIGWMAIPWTDRIEIGDKEWKDVIYPAALNVTEAGCKEAAPNLKLLGADANYRSVVLIEQEGDMTSSIAANIPRRRALNIEQDIALHVWLNDHQDTTHIVKAQVIKEFYRKIYKQVKVQWPSSAPDADYNLFINKLRVTFVREIQDPFSDYDFAKEKNVFHGKYAAFGMILHLSGLIFPNCAPAYPDLEHGCGPTAYVVDEFQNKIIG